MTARGRGKSAKSLELIHAAHDILQEIQPATVRAVCYRLFITGLISSMSKAETNKVSTQLVYAREQNIIPWEWIVDETREAERPNTWHDPEHYMRAVLRSYRRDLWTSQPEWIEIVSEKGTVRGTIAPLLEQYAITFRVMHGHGSATALYDAAMDTINAGKRLTILYVGDHDPSGMHMSEIDLPTRIARYGGDVEIIRVAITEDDMTSGLPLFAAKQTDTRCASYIEAYGYDCCELDALSPAVLRERLEQHITARMDTATWMHALKVEGAEQKSMSEFFGTWKGISGQATK